MKGWWVHPRLRDLEAGSQPWFEAQREMIFSKPLVKRCYDLWYARFREDLNSVPAQYRDRAVVELGSGSGYLKSAIPEALTSDVVAGVADLVFDGRRLPFAAGSLRGILLSHVFHHIPDAGAFLREACRTLAPGGVVSMIEETHTPFARFFFSRIHPEPYDDQAADWSFPGGHTLYDSNQALPWIVFFRDRKRFEEEFPQLRLEAHSFLPWFSYLLSGGVNLRDAVPGALAPAVARLDGLLRPLDPLCAIHWHLRIRKLAS